MPDHPLAYFITYTTAGTWLHGKAEGSVDPQHNDVGTPFIPGEVELEEGKRAKLKQPSYKLDAPRRRVVLKTIQEVCRHRGWELHACHVRSTHVHAVVAAHAAPEKVMNDFKAYASRRLTEAGFDTRDRNRWTRHGSTKYIWDEAYLQNAVRYVLEEQGEPMERYPSEPDLRGESLPYGRGSE
ncbi:MAG: transposase [Planctomycetes bacterium]|nr:transposase [Planctomycetota bacterium]